VKEEQKKREDEQKQETQNPSQDVIMEEDNEDMRLAMELSMQQPQEESKTEISKEEKNKEDEYLNDPEYMQSILSSLPGVDLNSDTIKNMLDSLKQEKKDDEKKDDEKKDNEKK